jgi:hypothetical protein
MHTTCAVPTTGISVSECELPGKGYFWPHIVLLHIAFPAKKSKEYKDD